MLDPSHPARPGPAAAAGRGGPVHACSGRWPSCAAWAHLPAVVCAGLSCACALAAVSRVADAGARSRTRRRARASSGSGFPTAAPGWSVEFALSADQLAGVMLLAVTFIGFWIVVFSIGYMHGSPGFPRYFAVGQPVPGVDDPAGAGRQLPADVRRLGGRRAVQLPADRLLAPQAVGRGRGPEGVPGHPARRRRADPRHLPALVGDRADELRPTGRLRRSAADFVRATPSCSRAPACCCSAGRSASRPSSRCTSGCPTRWRARRPVSALIHAATMVTAGVYLLARCTPLFVLVPGVQLTVAIIGAATALLAAFIALTQHDLKRVLALLDGQPDRVHVPGRSAVPARRVPALAITAAMFHLFTHAFFKARPVPVGRERHARDARRDRHARSSAACSRSCRSRTGRSCAGPWPWPGCRSSPGSGRRTWSSKSRLEAGHADRFGVGLHASCSASPWRRPC